MSQVSDTADVLLTRQRVAEALTAAGYPICEGDCFDEFGPAGDASTSREDQCATRD